VIVEPVVHDRRVDLDVGMVLLDERDPLGRRDDADHPDVARAGLAQQVERRTALPPVASIGSIIST
jgi:hypothetical protein